MNPTTDQPSVPRSDHSSESTQAACSDSSLEAERLAALYRYGILDTPPEESFDDLVSLAAAICAVPIAVIALLDEKRFWFKSKRGILCSEIPREAALGGWTSQELAVMQIVDSQCNERFSAHLLGEGAPSIRFCASVPLVTPEGYLLGLLCVMDHQPRDLSVMQCESLMCLGRQALAQMSYRLRLQADIREREEAQSALAKAERQFYALFEFAPEAIVIADAEGRIKLLNRQAESMFGYKREDLYGELIEALMPAPLREGHQKLRRGYIAASMPRVMGEGRSNLRGLRKDGTIFPLDVSLSPLEGESGKLVAATVRDITERLRQEEDRLARAIAEEANQAKSAFLAAMSHEIRTPMNAVLGLAELLSHTELSPPQAEMVSTMRESAGILLHLIDDILDFSKIEAGRLELERTPVFLSELVENVTRSLVSLAAKKDVALHLFVSPKLPMCIWSDKFRLGQVVYNLLGNAIKFSMGRSEKKGSVSLRAEIDAENPRKISLRVSDNGVGISSEVMNKLFTPFTQGESATTRRFGGTGLGLAICRRIVHLMGGEIVVESELDQGSTFTVSLPVEVVEGEEEQPSLQELAKVRCILLPSHVYRGEDLRSYLEHAGAAVVYPTGEEAEALLHKASEESILIGDAEILSKIAVSSRFRQVLIGRGRQQQPRLENDHVISIDADALRYANLVRAVAVAAGRASPAIKLLETEPLAPAALDISAARAAGRLILVAEDDVINQKVILQQLRLLGYAAVIAGDGEEAFKMWKEGHYALLLADLHMPVMDGYALTRAIRAQEAAVAEQCIPRLPILALTANALRGEDSHARAAGMDDYLTKPISLDHLRAALERWLPPIRSTQEIPHSLQQVIQSIPDPSRYTEAPSYSPALSLRRKEAPSQSQDALPSLEEEASPSTQAPLAVDLNVLKKIVGEEEAMIRDLLGEYLLQKACRSRYLTASSQGDCALGCQADASKPQTVSA